MVLILDGKERADLFFSEGQEKLEPDPTLKNTERGFDHPYILCNSEHLIIKIVEKKTKYVDIIVLLFL